jgi:hypothetical protein
MQVGFFISNFLRWRPVEAPVRPICVGFKTMTAVGWTLCEYKQELILPDFIADYRFSWLFFLFLIYCFNSVTLINAVPFVAIRIFRADCKSWQWADSIVDFCFWLDMLTKCLIIILSINKSKACEIRASQNLQMKSKVNMDLASSNVFLSHCACWAPLNMICK